jgi:hypothetical protein
VAWTGSVRGDGRRQIGTVRLCLRKHFYRYRRIEIAGPDGAPTQFVDAVGPRNRVFAHPL